MSVYPLKCYSFLESPFRHVSPVTGASLSPVKLAQKNYHHSRPVQMLLPETEPWAGTAEGASTHGPLRPVFPGPFSLWLWTRLAQSTGSETHCAHKQAERVSLRILSSQRVYIGREGHNRPAGERETLLGGNLASYFKALKNLHLPCDDSFTCSGDLETVRDAGPDPGLGSSPQHRVEQQRRATSVARED